jgi:hypothetical protein
MINPMTNKRLGDKNLFKSIFKIVTKSDILSSCSLYILIVSEKNGARFSSGKMGINKYGRQPASNIALPAKIKVPLNHHGFAL